MIERRRRLCIGAAAAAAALAAPILAPAVAAPSSPLPNFARAGDFAALERASGGRLGVCLLDTASGRCIGHRQHERFPLCSTFKAMLAAAVLADADRGRLSLDRRLPVRATDLLDHTPWTARHVGKDMTVRDLCRAAVISSDGTAANLLLSLIGGPAALTAFLRAIGDEVTRSDRYEPQMNSFALDDPRDTTSPEAIAVSLQRCVLGDALGRVAQQQLADWLIDARTGEDCLRAGLGKRWRVGDKTGNNGVDSRNDIAVLWAMDGATPWIVSAYLQGASVDSIARNAVLARVGALADALIG